MPLTSAASLTDLVNMPKIKCVKSPFACIIKSFLENVSRENSTTAETVIGEREKNDECRHETITEYGKSRSFQSMIAEMSSVDGGGEQRNEANGEAPQLHVDQ
ncbi:hypothetical protein H5410_045106 [Solanum commersonii]|uniref:Uncharacterized protein n=1 Tax=Solanum commersonii TaxID=4109 RepID=A0A9J5XCR3_SOLCO|nr:hypothetical protein H5410_045106 [Solanum commersonii]